MNNYLKNKKILIVVVIFLASLSTLFTLKINPFQVLLSHFQSLSVTNRKTISNVAYPANYNLTQPLSKMSEVSTIMGKPFINDNDTTTITIENGDNIYTKTQVYRKSAKLGLVAVEFDTYLKELITYLNSINGVIIYSYTGLADHGSLRYSIIQAEIPVERFEQSLTTINQKATKMIEEQTQAENLTGQIINKQEQLQKLIDQKSELEIKLVSTINQLEKQKIEIQLRLLNNQIEKLEKQMEIKQQVAYAGIYLRIANHERYFTGEPDYLLSFKLELEKAGKSLLANLSTLMQFAIWLFVYAQIWATLLFLAFTLSNKITKKTK